MRQYNEANAGYFVPVGVEMAAFDALPASVKHALNGSVYKYSAHEVAMLLRKGYTEQFILASMLQKDRTPSSVA